MIRTSDSFEVEGAGCGVAGAGDGFDKETGGVGTEEEPSLVVPIGSPA